MKFLLPLTILIIAIAITSKLISTGESNTHSLTQLSDSDFIVLTVKGDENIKLNLEVAESENKKAYGLMNREELPNTSGMIFIYNNEQYLRFWMKDTLIPLDIIFLDSNLQVINIEEAKANQTTEKYASAKPARYVIEVNQGWSRENRVEEGDVFTVVR